MRRNTKMVVLIATAMLVISFSVNGQHRRNYFKVNLSSLAVNNYGVQYERAVAKRISVALSGRYMPKSNLPLRSVIKGQFDKDDADAIEMIDKLLVSNYAITPEMKVYFGKGYGQGFYMSLFYRYMNFELSDIPVHFDSDGGTDRTLDIAGRIQSHTGGFLIGWQKSFARIVTLDLWLLGPHIGKATGALNGYSATPFTPIEQQNLQQALDDVDIPFVSKTTKVDANDANLSLSGPWGGIRTGISVGVRF